MQNYVVEQFFKPTLGAAPPPAGDSSDGPLATIGNAIKDVAGFFSVTYTLKQIDRNELKTLSYQLNAASAERLTLRRRAYSRSCCRQRTERQRSIRTS